MKELIEEHIKKFGVAPNIIGMFFNDVDAIVDGIEDAIENNKPYDEYKMLTDEEKKLFNEQKLVF